MGFFCVCNNKSKNRNKKLRNIHVGGIDYKWLVYTTDNFYNFRVIKIYKNKKLIKEECLDHGEKTVTPSMIKNMILSVS